MSTPEYNQALKTLEILVDYLDRHEFEIACDENDFGDLKPVFEDLFKRAPRTMHEQTVLNIQELIL